MSSILTLLNKLEQENQIKMPSDVYFMYPYSVTRKCCYMYMSYSKILKGKCKRVLSASLVNSMLNHFVFILLIYWVIIDLKH